MWSLRIHGTFLCIEQSQFLPQRMTTALSLEITKSILFSLRNFRSLIDNYKLGQRYCVSKTKAISLLENRVSGLLFIMGSKSVVLCLPHSMFLPAWLSFRWKCRFYDAFIKEAKVSVSVIDKRLIAKTERLLKTYNYCKKNIILSTYVLEQWFPNFFKSRPTF